MKKHIGIYLMTAAMMTEICPPALWADAPGEFYYRGQLTGADASFTGNKDVTFSIWDAPSGGNSLFTETQSGLNVTSGAFGTRIGSATNGGIPATNLQGGANRWLDIAISGEPATARQKIAASAYALAVAAQSVGALELRDSAVGTVQLKDGAVTPSKLNLTNGNVGIGTQTPAYLLDVVGGGLHVAGSGVSQLNLTNAATGGTFQFNVFTDHSLYVYPPSGSSYNWQLGDNTNATYFRIANNAWSDIVHFNGDLSSVFYGDIAVKPQGNGVIIRATNGPNCFRITVDNAGALSTSSVPCPQ